MMNFIQKNQITASIFAILLTTMLCYSGTLHVPFVFDDAWYFEQYNYFRSFEWMLDSKYWLNFNFRSVALASFSVNYNIHKLWLPGYHIVSILIHATNGILFFFLVKKINEISNKKFKINGLLISLIAVALFVCHPIQTQAVNYVIQRMTVLATLFYLCAILCYLHFRTTKQNIVKKIVLLFLVLISYYLSVFSKQIGATIILSIFLIELIFFTEQRSKLRVIIIGSIFLISIALALVFLKVTHHAILIEGNVNYLLTQAKVLVFYLQMIVIPVGLSIDHLMPLSNGLGVMEVVGVVLFLSLLALIFVYRKKAPLLAFGIGWFLITMQVESGFFPIKDTMVDHRLYLPMIGLAMAIASIIAGIYENFNISKKQLTRGLLFLFVMLCLVTILRNRVWTSASDLWIDAWEKNKMNLRALNNAGYALIEEERYVEAKKYLALAVIQTPKIQEPITNLGFIYFKLHDTAQVRACLERISVNYGLNYYSRCLEALHKASLGQLKEADSELQTCVNESPDYYLAYKYLGDIYYDVMQYKTALHWYTLALRNSPGKRSLLKNINNCKTANNEK